MDVLNDIVNISVEEKDEKKQIEFLTRHLYENKFNSPEFSKKKPYIMIFAPTSPLDAFRKTLASNKFDTWFRKNRDEKVSETSARNLALQLLVSLFNHVRNKTAEYFNIFAADKSAREGLSLNLMRNVYFLRVPNKMSTFKQVIGRATRWCNFRSEENVSEWKVRPYLLFFSEGDQKNFAALLKMQGDVANDVLEFLKVVSIDCYLFGAYTHNINEEYACGKKDNFISGPKGKNISELKTIEAKKSAKPKEQLCVDYIRGIIFALGYNRKCPENKSVILVPHDYNEIDAFAENYIFTKLNELNIPIFSGNKQVNPKALTNYLLTSPKTYFSKYDSPIVGMPEHYGEKFLEKMLPYLYCQSLTRFSYTKLYSVLESLPIEYLRGWLNIILRKKISFSSEENKEVKNLLNQTRERLVLLRTQEKANKHLFQLKSFLSKYPTLTQPKPPATGKLQVATITQRSQPFIPRSDYVLTGKNEIDYILTDKNLTSQRTTKQKNHGPILTDSFS